jgi:hypothetical protein
LYQSLGDLLEELLEVEGSAVGAVIDVLEETEDELVFGVEAESAGSDEEVASVCSSLSGVCVEAEEGVELLDVLGRQHWVLGGDVFAEDGLEFLVLNLFFGH